MRDVLSPVLVVGAGQELLVAELQAKGFKCDGVDLSSEMIKHARSRRGLDLIQADASALPLGAGTVGVERGERGSGLLEDFLHAGEQFLRIVRFLEEARRAQFLGPGLKARGF